MTGPNIKAGICNQEYKTGKIKTVNIESGLVNHKVQNLICTIPSQGHAGIILSVAFQISDVFGADSISMLVCFFSCRSNLFGR